MEDKDEGTQAVAPESKEVVDQIQHHAATTETWALLADGFEDALIGYCDPPFEGLDYFIAVYDRDKCIEILMKRDGMEYDKAVEFFEFNVVGAHMGPGTPAFVTILRNAR